MWRGLSTNAILFHLDHCNTGKENMTGWKKGNWGERESWWKVMVWEGTVCGGCLGGKPGFLGHSPQTTAGSDSVPGDHGL